MSNKFRLFCQCTVGLALLLVLAACSKSPKPGPDGAAAAPATPETRFLAIGTGGLSGVYYPVGGAIASLINEEHDRTGLRAKPESTDGSVFNVNGLLNGDLDFGIVQSDIQYQAVSGTGEWQARGPQPKLRAVLTLFPELVTLVAATDAGITSVADLRGKRVNLDAPGSGTRPNALMVLARAGLDVDKDLQAQSVSAKQAPALLQDGRLDAFFFTAAHPNGTLKEVFTGSRAVRLIPLTGMEELLAKSPWYTSAMIPISFYPKSGQTEDVPTFGVQATLMTSDSVPEEVVYELVKTVCTHLDRFIAQHAALTGLTPARMLLNHSAPLHPGAARAFRELGVLPAEGAPAAANPPAEAVKP